MATNGHDLHSLVMCSLYAPTWTAYKKDARVTAEVKRTNHVDQMVDAGSFNKMMLPDCGELDKLKSFFAATRMEFYARTAPWGEQRGVRATKAEEYMSLMQWFGDRQALLEPLKEDFGAIYPSKVAAMEFVLNDMFNPADYPPVDGVLDRFQLKLSVVPLPNVNDIRLLTEIPEHVREELEAALTTEIAKSYASTVEYTVTELLKPVQHMATTLRKYQTGDVKKLYESVIDNVRNIAVMATKLNLSRDPAIDALAKQAGELVRDLTAKDLKDSAGQMSVTAIQAEKLAARIAKFIPA